METEGEAASGGESAERGRTKGNSSGTISDESATTTEDEEGNWDYIDREVSLGKVLTEDEEMDGYRRGLEYLWGDEFGSFEQETTVSSMLTTHKAIQHASTASALQVYSIQVEETKLTWPLQVYGMVAARDHVDHNRNILFNRNRDSCQIITEEDPGLLLTGPSRAIVFLDPVEFEIDLKVKRHSSEDKERLIHQVYRYNGTTGLDGTRCSNDNCTIYLYFNEIAETVQATITSVQIICGSWPSGFAWQIACSDGSPHEEVVLLDFQDGSRSAPVADRDGNLDLSRRVVSVDVHKDMVVSVRAYSVCPTVSSMLTTHKAIQHASTASALQVYSIQVEETKLTWPLQVYGMVAARDPVDHNRNILFNRNRDSCQIITEEDPGLLLTGPSRAIVFLDPVEFEIDLKVKGHSSEDKERLIHQVYRYNGTTGLDGTRCSNDNCTIYLHFNELVETVQATITSVQIIRGSWPSGFAGQIACSDGSPHEEVVLLDFQDGSSAPVADRDGNLDLSRRVVSVDVHKDMVVSVRAYSVCRDLKETIVSGDVMFRPQRCGVTEGQCDLGGNCQVKFRVAWSLLVVANWLLPS